MNIKSKKIDVRCSNCSNFNVEKDDDYRWVFISCTEGNFHMMQTRSDTIENHKGCGKFKPEK